MLIPVVVFLVAVMIASARIKGPIWALCIAWLISLAPIATGAVIYRYLVDDGYALSITLILYIGAFVAGVALYEGVRRTGPPPDPAAPRYPTPETLRRAYDDILPVARVCWWVAMFATALNYIDFTLLGGAGLDDLAALRDSFANKPAASAYAQIASILTWTCLFCYMFAFFFRNEMPRRQFIWFLLPIIGYFSLSVFSAGRQAAFQIMLTTILLVIVIRTVRGPGPAKPRRVTGAWLTRERLGVLAISAAMIGYMGYVAVARNDGAISDDKAKLLMVIFEFQYAPFFERLTEALGAGLRGAIVEGVVYFSSSPALFDPFLTIEWPTHYYGAMTFPFFFRQVEWLTGISVVGGMAAKVDAINATGVLGSGWATSMSSYIIDFGFIGSVIFVFIMGLYSGFVWRKAIVFASFYYVVIAVIILMNAIYMPLTPSVSETNFLLLWLFCLLMHYRPYRYLLPMKLTAVTAA